MLTIQFIPYKEVVNLDKDNKVKKLLNVAKDEKIVILEGRLTAEEEIALIKTAMEQVTKKFKGIEISTYYHEPKNVELVEKLKKNLAQFLLGYQQGITIIGPATVIKDIKKDPTKIELFTVDKKRRK